MRETRGADVIRHNTDPATGMARVIRVGVGDRVDDVWLQEFAAPAALIFQPPFVFRLQS